MKQGSLAYKQAMAKQFRDRAYGVISIGIINKQAQRSVRFDSDLLYLSNTDAVLKLGDVVNNYASFEENQTRADGTCIFPLENGEYFQKRLDVGVISQNLKQAIKVVLNKAYDLKGLTIDFDNSYPTDFTVTNGTNTYTYTLDKPLFECTDVFNDTSYLLITPTHFVDGDNKRLRINYILMGVGIQFTNDDIEELSLIESVSYTSEELPSMRFSCKLLDMNNLFNVDDETSFINYLIDGQELEVSLGQTLHNNAIEWIELPTVYLSDWSASKYHISFMATDRFKLLTEVYEAGNTIHTRTLYDDAIDVLTAAGLEPDEYVVDTCLEDIEITNPLPAVSYAQCLQLIANAGRCKLKQSTDGRIWIEGNFENIIEPTELIVNANEEAGWSTVGNTRFGTNVVYAEFTRQFASADGSMLFIPEDSNEYLLDQTTFVSAEIADDDGLFTTNPQLTLELPASFSYFGITLVFNGNPPPKVKIATYNDNDFIEENEFDISYQTQYIVHPFLKFNKMTFEFEEAVPRNRILIKQIALGELTDYTLDRFSMKEEPIGTVEKRVKDVRVRVCSFEPPSQQGRSPTLVQDEVYVTHDINAIGSTVTFENQLIGTQAHAQTVAKWLANYYANNITYQVQYRGDPVLDAGDIIYMESEIINNLQVEIEECDLSFNGAFSGKLNLRRAVNMVATDDDEPDEPDDPNNPSDPDEPGGNDEYDFDEDDFG